MVAAAPRRLPGIRFEAVTPPPAGLLPRMDVAVFVGFARRGPVDRPVALDDVADFDRVFGEDLALAWDQERRRPVRAHLAAAVRAFFRNGGRRCWVIRVAVGAAGFDPSRFLDPGLVEFGVETLMEQADYIRYRQPVPRSLRGIHAALGIEEATIISVPDAVHVGWAVEPAVEPAPAAPFAPLPRPRWWRFLDCPPVAPLPLARAPRWGNFLDCGIEVIAPPDLRIETGPDENGTVGLGWDGIADARYVLQAATVPSFAGAVTVYDGGAVATTIRGQGAGASFYRLRAEVGANGSDWSAALAVRVPTRSPNRQRSASAFDREGLLLIHRALLRMCAARGDLLAVLTLPAHAREDEAIDYVELLRALPGEAPGALGGTERRALGYGAIYHPWMEEREAGERGDVEQSPPDGAVCGILARRAGRGAWIAPANEPLDGVVALAPTIAAERRQELFDAQINELRREPRGFLTLGADTLAEDADVRPINVRRLLSLLRRLALDRGNSYIFEPNDDAFRRLIERDFEAMLDDLFVRGAFAGGSPAEAYRVVVDAALNPPTSVEQGRLIVELKVAPSQPLQFLTVRLVHSPARALAVVEG